MDFKTIPKKPGCYIYKDSQDRIIYIGKAKNLKKRVSSYFQKKDHDPKTQQLLKHIDTVDFVVTNTEVEALILENTLIKKHQPKYNIDLKDAKRYSYLELTPEEFPRLLTARSKQTKGKIFGPFTSGSEREYIRTYLIKAFKLRTCKRFPKKPCLRYHIKICDAPCVGHISKTEYHERTKQIAQILKGNAAALLSKMNKEMKTYSERMKYEKALELRERISAVTYLEDKQTMERSKVYDEDIINYLIKDDKVFLLLFNIQKGVLSSKHEFSFDYKDNFLEQFIIQYYAENPIPKELILPVEMTPTIASYLTEQAKKKVIITKPKIGEKKTLLEIVKKNVEISFFGDFKRLEQLQKDLKLNEVPYIIECFDISHLGGTSTVGSMVQFRNGKPDKSNYRRFKIRTVEGIDDFSSIAEVVRRRYRRQKSEHAELPHLIVIDGGKGQLSAAYEELVKLELKIPVIGLAKRLEEVFVPGISFSLKIDQKSEGLLLLRRIRDEAHRFAISYNRVLRKNSLLK
jgi:excinuclease ABC subunit C